MSDNKEKTDLRDRTQINMNEPYEVQYWTDKWNISAEELKDAIIRAGSENVEKVKEALKSIGK